MAIATFICGKCGLENTYCHCPRAPGAPYFDPEVRRAERLAELEREQAANIREIERRRR